MLRKLILVGVVVGTSASVPVLYEANPEVFRDWLRGNIEEEKRASPRATVAALHPLVERGTEELSGRRVRLPADDRGHFSGDFRLNGKAVEAMIDTGATLVAINETTARRIGLKLQASDFIHRVTTANGEARAAAATIERIAIGRIEVRDVQAVVLEDDALSGTLVGITFLSRLRQYQVSDGQLTMEQ